MNNVDKEYFRLLQTILDNGRVKKNRTGVDTIGVFGEQAKFKISLNEFPILTTKKVYFRAIVHELLWFIKGDTNIKYLVDNDVHIWDEWAYKRYAEETGVKGHISTMLPIFIRDIKEDANFAEKWGELGEGTYGSMWRAFPYADIGFSGFETEKNTVDQLQKVIDKLKTDPDDRRMIVTAWHPYWVDHCALPPCHCLFHFNTEELTFDERMDIFYEMGNSTDIFNDCDDEYVSQLMNENKVPTRRLNCLLYQRSVDSALGLPFNITSYCLLTAMIAQCVNMAPGIFTHTYGDLHIYQNHLDGVKEQMTRIPRMLPKLWLNPEVKDLFSFKYDDIKLIGYDPHPTIKLDVAV